MTSATFLGSMMPGKQARRIWMQRWWDYPLDPVSIYRTILLLAAAGLTTRCGAAAVELWGWNPDYPVTIARVMMAKRWIDPIAVACGMAWMVLEAGTSSAKLGSLVRGTAVTVLEDTGEWVRFVYQGRDAWVNDHFLTQA